MQQPWIGVDRLVNRYECAAVCKLVVNEVLLMRGGLWRIYIPLLTSGIAEWLNN
jgi:hypothetical protein